VWAWACACVCVRACVRACVWACMLDAAGEHEAQSRPPAHAAAIPTCRKRVPQFLSNGALIAMISALIAMIHALIAMIHALIAIIRALIAMIRALIAMIRCPLSGTDLPPASAAVHAAASEQQRTADARLMPRCSDEAHTYRTRACACVRRYTPLGACECAGARDAQPAGAIGVTEDERGYGLLLCGTNSDGEVRATGRANESCTGKVLSGSTV
jgi:hypothetical protein